MHARSVADSGTRVGRAGVGRRWYERYVDRVIAIDESVRRSLGGMPNVEVIYNPYSRAGRAARPRGTRRAGRFG